MSDEHVFPVAVLLGLWLNAAHTRAVSSTDAANAVETVTNQVGTLDSEDSLDSTVTPWKSLVDQVVAANAPVAVGLPVDGNPAGVPAYTLSRINRESGVVSVNPNLLLCQTLDGVWSLVNSENNVKHHDLTQARRSLAEQVEIAAKQLAASDLTGDDSAIVKELNEFRSLHLPPHLSRRTVDALELAAKVLIISREALASTNALHSPSTDRKRIEILKDLIAESRIVMQSVILA